MFAASALLFSACATTASTDEVNVAANEMVSETPQTSQTADGKAMPEEKVIKPETFSSTVVDGDGLICKYRAVTGSNFRRKVCGTAQDWAEAEGQARTATEKIQNRNRGFEPVR